MTENIITAAYEKPTSNLREYGCTYLMSFSLLGERFSFWGLQAILVLFLIQSFSQSENNAVTLVGAFGALNYVLSLLGGLLTDKLLGVWKSSIMGLMLCLVGNLMLIFSYNLISLNVGLSCVLVGAGLFSPSSTTSIRMIFEKKPDLKESGFLITCIAGNISGAVAPLIYGIFGGKGLWHYAFFVSVILNILSLFFLFKYSKIFFHLCGDQIDEANNSKLGKIIAFGLIILALILLIYVNWLNTIFLIFIAPLLLFAVAFYKQLNSNEKQRIKFIFFLTVILLFFYTAVFQIYSSLTLFIDRYVNRMILGWEIPVPAFSSLQCIFFIICAPIVERLLALLRKKGYSPSLILKIPMGLIIGSIGFILFGLGEWIAIKSGSCSVSWLIAGNFFLGLGEVFLYPPILTAVSSFSPKHLSSTLIGVFSLSLAMSSYLSGQLAKLITNGWTINIRNNISIFHLGYTNIAIFLIMVSFFTAVIFLYLNKWYHKQEKLIHAVGY